MFQLCGVREPAVCSVEAMKDQTTALARRHQQSTQELRASDSRMGY